ncbi:hypothetical protein SAMN04489751_1831 [Brevibacterium sandarakinum]|uniref:Uncharacterized protein n=2 Tax=Brevibacterium TaxID=1696 RepID=A0A1H1RJH3_BRESA|nr:hypothetical protein SAMN04489751_1831 [Brevibacterium sandarakinum]
MPDGLRLYGRSVLTADPEGAAPVPRADPEDATQTRFLDWAAMNEQLMAVGPESAEVRAWT